MLGEEVSGVYWLGVLSSHGHHESFYRAGR